MSKGVSGSALSDVREGPSLTVSALLDDEACRAILSEKEGKRGLDRRIDHPRIQKSGLALTGHMVGIVPTRIQILGETEISYLETLTQQDRAKAVDCFFANTLSCVIVTRGVPPCAELLEAARRTSTPLFSSSEKSSRTIAILHHALDELLAPRMSMHGVLVEVHGVGLLLRGPSGIGKSEMALTLVERGHRLVADDMVELVRGPLSAVTGSAPPLLRYHLEVRGIGILNIRDLFGATSVRDRANIDLLIDLCIWNTEETYERLGFDEVQEELLGVPFPKLKIPVREGQNMGVILEVAARNELLKRSGIHSARRFGEALVDQMENSNEEST